GAVVVVVLELVAVDLFLAPHAAGGLRWLGGDLGFSDRPGLGVAGLDLALGLRRARGELHPFALARLARLVVGRSGVLIVDLRRIAAEAVADGRTVRQQEDRVRPFR